MHCKFSNRQVRSYLEVKLQIKSDPQMTKFKYLGLIKEQDSVIVGDVNRIILTRWCR